MIQLFKAKADAGILDKSGAKALYRAAENGLDSVTRAFFDAGVIPKEQLDRRQKPPSEYIFFSEFVHVFLVLWFSPGSWKCSSLADDSSPKRTAPFFGPSGSKKGLNGEELYGIKFSNLSKFSKFKSFRASKSSRSPESSKGLGGYQQADANSSWASPEEGA